MSKRGDLVLFLTAGLATALILVCLIVIVGDVLIHGAPRLSLAFLLESPRNGLTAGGIFPAIVGTAAVTILMSVAGIPVGVATAIYLSEYASPTSRFAAVVRLAVQNLAGVPSIVFGLFGLGFFIRFLGQGIDAAVGGNAFSQPSLLWGALTMAVLTLPVTIVATEEALRTVPKARRDAAYALGATKLQAVFTVILPEAAAGVLTGAILAVSRGAGEVAPILFTGAAFFLPRLPDSLTSQFMHLGYHVYVLATQSPDIDATEPLLYATVAVLLALVFTLNLGAMILRARLRRNVPPN